METKKFYGKCLNYEIKEYDNFGNVPRFTNTKFKVLDFGSIENMQGKAVHLEALRLRRSSYTIYINGIDQGSYAKPDVLRNIFSDKIAKQIAATIIEAEMEIVNSENLKVYVPRKQYDDPAYKAMMEAKNEYWRTHEGEYIKILSKLTTDIAFYVTIETPHETIEHHKFRISNIMKTSVNIDESMLVTDLKNNVVLPEAYITTYRKIKLDDIASWLWFEKGIKAEQTEPTHEAF